MNKKYLIGVFAIMACVAVASGAYAFGGFPKGLQGNEAAKQALDNGDYEAFVEAVSSEITEEMFGQVVERREAMASIQQALEEGDYEAWVQAVENMPRITDKITEENFQGYVAMQEARENGDRETAMALAEELGLGMNHPHGGFGFRMRHNAMPCARMEGLQGSGAGS